MEKEIELHGITYVAQKLPLEDSTEVLLRVMKLAGGASDPNFGAIVAGMSMKDINFLREKLLGRYCHLINETGDGVPLTPRIVNTHFAGHPGRMIGLLLQCLIFNFADFLADLDLSGMAADLVALTADASPE